MQDTEIFAHTHEQMMQERIRKREKKCGGKFSEVCKRKKSRKQNLSFIRVTLNMKTQGKIHSIIDEGRSCRHEEKMRYLQWRVRLVITQFSLTEAPIMEEPCFGGEVEKL